MERRAFVTACAACALAGAEARAAADLKPRFYGRVQLTDGSGRPLKASSLVAGRNYLFHYPFEATPCFLLNLGRPTAADVELKTDDGSTYRWSGGVGRRRAVVGYSAICAHRMSYPTRQISFISYRERPAAGGGRSAIRCCSEHSEYDPAAGARVLGGPATQPLAAILLEHDAASDALTAVGTLGGELFNDFFAKFEFRLALDYGSGMRRRVAGSAVVTELEAFCRQRVQC